MSAYTRVGKLIAENGIVLNAEESKLVEEVLQSSPTVTSVEVWREADGILGIQVWDDGMYLTAFFNPDGSLRGDWF